MERWEGEREWRRQREKDNQQAGATKAGIHDLISQFIMGRERNERPTGGQNIGKGKASRMEGKSESKIERENCEDLKKEHRDHYEYERSGAEEKCGGKQEKGNIDSNSDETATMWATMTQSMHRGGTLMFPAPIQTQNQHINTSNLVGRENNLVKLSNKYNFGVVRNGLFAGSCTNIHQVLAPLHINESWHKDKIKLDHK